MTFTINTSPFSGREGTYVTSRNLRDRLFRPGASIDLGLVVLALWLFTQLNPATLLFGNGDLRQFFDGDLRFLEQFS